MKEDHHGTQIHSTQICFISGEGVVYRAFNINGVCMCATILCPINVTNFVHVFQYFKQ